jgi:UDP-2,3-diacylglucosamine hydrolase
MHSLFVSDLHLAAERPEATERFFDFASRIAPHAEALYVLGDLFEYWIGDDDLEEPFNASIADALARLSARGIALYFMHGNRDVLAGEAFLRRTGARPLADPALLELYGKKTLLMHGDTLCTADVEYQKFRARARDPRFQREFLSAPLEERRARMRAMRAASERHKQEAADEIMDASREAVEEALRAHGYPRLIHGHTHRPARHLHVVDGHACERWVLTDWYGRAGYLRCDASGCEAVAL